MMLNTIDGIQDWLTQNFVCPVDHSPLQREGNWYVSQSNPDRRYPIVGQTPVFLRSDIVHTSWRSKESLEHAQEIADGKIPIPTSKWDGSGVHPHVQSIIDSTGGHLYRQSRGKLKDYPIPRIRVDRVAEKTQVLLDVGCNWGRWTFSAVRQGIPSVGVDPSLGAVIAANEIRDQLGLPCAFFVGDSRWLPFRENVFSDVFSYSVIQHFRKSDAQITIGELHRILELGGHSLIQMPNAYGIRSTYHLVKRGFSAGEHFDVRYYSVGELSRLFEGIYGNSIITVDGYFGLGIQPDDRSLMPLQNRIVIDSSEFLRRISLFFPPMKYVADSLYIATTKE